MSWTHVMLLFLFLRRNAFSYCCFGGRKECWDGKCRKAVPSEGCGVTRVSPTIFDKVLNWSWKSSFQYLTRFRALIRIPGRFLRTGNSDLWYTHHVGTVAFAIICMLICRMWLKQRWGKWANMAPESVHPFNLHQPGPICKTYQYRKSFICNHLHEMLSRIAAALPAPPFRTPHRIPYPNWKSTHTQANSSPS